MTTAFFQKIKVFNSPLRDAKSNRKSKSTRSAFYRLLRRAENNRSAQKGFLNASVALKVDKDLQMRL